MSTQSAYHSKSGPAIGLADPATERDKLIAANYAFATALKQALRSGKETPAGVLGDGQAEAWQWHFNFVS